MPDALAHDAIHTPNPADVEAASPRHAAADGNDDNDHDDHDGSETRSIGHQRNLFTRRGLLVAMPGLSVTLFVSLYDQTAVSTAVPAVSDALDTGTATSWIGASFLISATAFQLINSRLSDIFGRKNLLLACLGTIAVGDLLCGFSRTKEQLFVFRAISGIGGGGINSIVMIIVSDITTLESRGKYQGFLGAMIAFANGVGPFVGGVLVDKASWRWVFWLAPIMAVPSVVPIVLWLPLKHDSGRYMAKVKMIDFGGIALSIAGTILFLIPLSGGGVTYPWDSAFVVSCLVVGGLLMVLFVLYEWKMVSVPLMPLRLFNAPHTPCLYAQSFLTGIGYFMNLFYLPIYFQSSLKYSPLVSGALILPLVCMLSIGSILSGQYMARLSHYMPPVVAGFAIWLLGAGLRLLFDRKTPLGVIVGVLLVEGLGMGLTVQSTMVGLLANSLDSDRAILTGLRNFLRTVGGAFGLTVSGTILSNTLSSRLLDLAFVDRAFVTRLTSSAYAIGELGLSAPEEEAVQDAYMLGLRHVFIFHVVNVAVCFLLNFGIGNTGLKRGAGGGEEEDGESGGVGGELEAREGKTE